MPYHWVPGQDLPQESQAGRAFRAIAPFLGPYGSGVIPQIYHNVRQYNMQQANRNWREAAQNAPVNGLPSQSGTPEPSFFGGLTGDWRQNAGSNPYVPPHDLPLQTGTDAGSDRPGDYGAQDYVNGLPLDIPPDSSGQFDYGSGDNPYGPTVEINPYGPTGEDYGSPDNGYQQPEQTGGGYEPYYPPTTTTEIPDTHHNFSGLDPNLLMGTPYYDVPNDPGRNSEEPMMGGQGMQGWINPETGEYESLGNFHGLYNAPGQGSGAPALYGGPGGTVDAYNAWIMAHQAANPLPRVPDINIAG